MLTRQELAEMAGLLASESVLFKLQYHHDPLAFVHDCVNFVAGERLADYQEEILEELVPRKRIAVRGPHGLGKTALAAWIVLWAVLTAEDVKVPTTASAWRQVTKFLWPEIHKWTARLDWKLIGRDPFNREELLTLSLKLGPTREAFGVVSDNEALIEGAHAKRVVYVFDEAKEIPNKTWDAAEGAFAGAGADTPAEAFALAISTPGEPGGRFYDIHSRKPGYEDWWPRHVKLEEAIAAGRISREWAEARARQWGETSAVYLNRVKGEFATSEESGIISLAWVEAANERWREWNDAGRPMCHEEDGSLKPMDAVGVDVARSGEDQTVMAVRYGRIITKIEAHSKEETMQTTGRVAGILKAHGGKAIVDVIGIGAGVYDRLREQGYKATPFNAAAGSRVTDQSGQWGFVNKRAEAWWSLREMLSDPESQIMLPPDDKLTGDLTAPTWKATSGGKIKVEAKDDIKKRIGRSTDYGDAVVQAFWVGRGGPLVAMV